MKLVCLSLIALLVSADSSRWWSYVEFLASDDLQGRNTGSPGHRKAAEWVAAQFERDGLKPAGEQGYIQPVKFNTLHLDESQSSLTLIKDGKERKVQLGEDAIIGTRVEPAPSVEAGLVFVGYGLRVPEQKYDDFTGLYTKGKIAVYIGGGPSVIPGALASHYQTAAERWKTLKSLGYRRHNHDCEPEPHGCSLGTYRRQQNAGHHEPGRARHGGNRRPADRHRVEPGARR